MRCRAIQGVQGDADGCLPAVFRMSGGALAQVGGRRVCLAALATMQEPVVILQPASL
jgi:hypothetical protein